MRLDQSAMPHGLREQRAHDDQRVGTPLDGLGYVLSDLLESGEPFLLHLGRQALDLDARQSLRQRPLGFCRVCVALTMDLWAEEHRTMAEALGKARAIRPLRVMARGPGEEWAVYRQGRPRRSFLPVAPEGGQRHLAVVQGPTQLVSSSTERTRPRMAERANGLARTLRSSCGSTTSLL